MARKKKTVVPEEEVKAPELTPEEVNAAFINSPVVTTDSVTCGDKTYKILYLQYKDYSEFLGLMMPLFDELMGKGVNRNATIAELLGSSGVSVSHLFRVLSDQLPQLAQIVLRQTEPEITLDAVEEVCGDPLTMAEVVMAQIIKNKMIERFASFFGRIAVLMGKKK